MTELVDSSNWATRIRTAWQSSLVGIMECGQLLIEAKDSLGHGEFIAMVEGELPFKRVTAFKLMAVARDVRLSNVSHVKHFPPHWGTLYALTKLEDDEFEQGISSGAIHPEMERNRVSELRRLNVRNDYVNSSADGCTVKDLDKLIFTGKKFAVITADPPWSFNVYSGKGKARSADRHYDTQSLDDIKALGGKVQALATDDCALFLWAVMPELPGAIDVIAAWGFTYKTVAFTWIKQNRGGHGLFTLLQ